MQLINIQNTRFPFYYLTTNTSNFISTMFLCFHSHNQQHSIAHDVGTEVPQKVGSVALNATTTRQSLVKGERLVRDVVTAAILAHLSASSYPS